jgi:hypothetical protein
MQKQMQYLSWQKVANLVTVLLSLSLMPLAWTAPNLYISLALTACSIVVLTGAMMELSFLHNLG